MSAFVYAKNSALNSSLPAAPTAGCEGEHLRYPGMLSDPLIRAVMDADGVDAGALEAELGTIASKLGFAPRL